MKALLVATRVWDPEPWADRLRGLLPGRKVLATDRNCVFHGDDAQLEDVAYALVWKPTAETLDRLKHLDVVFSLGAGVDHIFALPHLPDAPIVRIVDPDLTRRMTEYVAWQALDHLRLGARFRRAQSARDWLDIDPPTASEVTVGLMGLGVMGRDAARALLGLGFRVRGWSRGGTTIEGAETFSGAAGLDTFLAGTDILVSLLPLTPDTKGLVDLAFLRKLRRDGALGGAVYINAGRGGTQVEADIATALREGTLSGASIDVFAEEPLDPESPLWGMEGVTITPHVAAVSDAGALARQIAGQIEAFERGEPLRNRVDRERGY